MSPDTVSECAAGCGKYVMPPQQWCHACCAKTETTQESLWRYMENGWNMQDALRLTLLDVYDAGRKRGTAADHRFPR